MCIGKDGPATMRPRVTLQLPRTTAYSPARSLRGQTLLLIGEGYTARALRIWAEANGLRVNATSRKGPMALGAPKMTAAFQSASHILISIPPGKNGDPALKALNGVPTAAKWIGYLSATSVYGDRQGGWAFEGEAPTPGLARGRRRADAELAWLETYPQTQIFRLAGIYGPGRSPFAKLKDGTARIVEAPGHVVNRIHIDDIIQALRQSMAAPCPGDILNLADGAPAAPGDVLDYAADLAGLPAARRVALNDPSLSDMARSFYAESKSVAITRAETRLGWTPQFKDYRAGLDAIWAIEKAQIS